MKPRVRTAGRQDGRLDRRDFLKVVAVAGGGLAIAVSLQGCGRRRGRRTGGENDPGVFVQITPENEVVITVPKSEMGQGVRTSLAMMVAEELDADWERVRVVNADYDPKYGPQGTGGSSSTPESWTRLRTAGAMMRAMLVSTAAAEWGVPEAEITTEASTLSHPSGKRASYGQFASRAAERQAPSNVPLKPRGQWRILGKDHPGIDVPDIIHGRATYGLDVRIPGMLFAAVERTRVFGGKVRSFDPSEAMQVPGVRQVVEVPQTGAGAEVVHAGVAVVADNTWAALEGRRRLRVEWDSGPHAGESSDTYREAMRSAIAAKGAETVFQLGDPESHLAAGGAQVVSAEYEFPFLSHATMEPQNCTVRVMNGKVEIWSPTQFPDWATGAVARALGMKEGDVTTHVTLMGGGFGRRINPDFTVEAALVAQRVRQPVQVVWTRADDLGHGFYRPCAMHRVDAVLGPDGFPLAWRHRFITPSINSYGGDAGKPPRGGWGADESDGSANMFYRIPNRAVEFTLLESGVPRGWWRAVHTTHNTFVVETMISELAERSGKDPVEYRMALIDQLPADAPGRAREFPQDPARLKAVLRLAAEKAGWGQGSGVRGQGRGMGIACGWDHNSHAAAVVEVSLVGQRVRVDRVTVAADCGPVLNPTGARAQLEGGAIQALSSVLKERITIRGGAVEQGNFDSYPILRISEAPPVIEAYFVESDAHPTGLGEPAVPVTGPALANAIYRATGRRVRSLPIGTSLPV